MIYYLYYFKKSFYFKGINFNQQNFVINNHYYFYIVLIKFHFKALYYFIKIPFIYTVNNYYHDYYYLNIITMMIYYHIIIIKFDCFFYKDFIIIK
jgi:hypothetical protein